MKPRKDPNKVQARCPNCGGEARGWNAPAIKHAEDCAEAKPEHLHEDDAAKPLTVDRECGIPRCHKPQVVTGCYCDEHSRSFHRWYAEQSAGSIP